MHPGGRAEQQQDEAMAALMLALAFAAALWERHTWRVHVEESYWKSLRYSALKEAT